MTKTNNNNNNNNNNKNQKTGVKKLVVNDIVSMKNNEIN